MSGSPRILIDMDEVLADFVGGVAREWVVSPDVLLRCWERGHWGILEPLQAALNAEHPEHLYKGKLALTEKSFWERLEGRTWFWQTLDVLPWAGEVIGTVNLFTDNWRVVSSPSRCETSYVGKIRWLRTFFRDPHFNRFHLTGLKSDFAEPNSLLIDDREESVERFIAAGGSGIVFPRHHNSLHAYKDDPVSYLKDKLLEWSSNRRERTKTV